MDMRAFFCIAMLLLFVAGASAFVPGPMVLRECPKCHVTIEEATMASGNSFMARYWSDGKMGAPMLPDYPWLVKCPKCKHLFWIDEAKKLGEVSNNPEKRGNVTSYKLEIPTVSDFYSVVEKTKDITKQKYIRNNLWHFANDPYRDKIPGGKYSLSAQEKANMSALSRLLNEKNPGERLQKAEIARELGQFDQCLKLLNAAFDKRYTNSVAAVKMLAEGKYAPVMEFTEPDTYQKRPEEVNAVPTDAENWLFMHALKESCVYAANGMLNRYKVNALLKSNPEKLKAVIKAGAAKGDGSAVALTLNTAVLDDSVESVRFLLDNGARVNGHASDRLITPLLTACLIEKENVARFLIDRGADVNAATDYGLTPLNIACRERYVGLAKLLLENGAEANPKDFDSNPLMTICAFTYGWPSGKGGIDWAKKNFELVKLLIDHKANVNGIDPIIGTWEYAYKSSPLIELCSIDLSGNEYYPGHYSSEDEAACEAIFLDTMRLLLDNRAKINKTDFYGSTALVHACEVGNIKAVKLLLERGADVNKANKEGETPLSIANKLPDKTIAKLLLGHGAKSEAKK